ncbi:MAG: c-type cytochrome biogenesis protein CcsB, partial [Nocardioidaceae bacterium]
MTTADFAAFSDNAIMAASIVYVLAFLAHLVESVLARSAPVPARELVSAGAPETRLEVVNEDDGSLRLEKWGRIGVALTVLGCALHFLGLVSRGLGTDPIRVPWGNMYEFTLAGTFGVSLMYLVLMRRYHLRWMGVLVTGFLVVVLMLDVLVLYQDAGPLVPALHSYWLAIHVLAAIIASGAFAVGALALILFLIKDRAVQRGTLRPGGYLSRLPETAVLDRVGYRLHAFGFPIWTFAALVAGPVWAEYAWGSYWNWDPKEVWAFITWVIYAAYLHARATAGWRGRAAALIA